MKFYAVIIGTEILNARREDKHFTFLRDTLAKYNHELFASFIIKDDINLMKNIYKLILDDKESVMFSFGGIGSTPDDLTRAIAAEVFTQEPLQRNKDFEKAIIERFKEDAYPHRIFMSDLPKESSLITNPVNNMSGFSLENRFFFVPGFVEMSHPMIEQVIKTHFAKVKEKIRYTFIAQTSEDTLISIMNILPKQVELSSLPMLHGTNGVSVEISLSGHDEILLKQSLELFYKELEKKQIEYKNI